MTNHCNSRNMGHGVFLNKNTISRGVTICEHLHFMQSSYPCTFDLVVIMTIFLGCHFQWGHYHLYNTTSLSSVSQETLRLHWFFILCTNRNFLWVFPAILCYQAQVLVDSTASHWGLAPSEAYRKSVLDG